MSEIVELLLSGIFGITVFLGVGYISYKFPLVALLFFLLATIIKPALWLLWLFPLVLGFAFNFHKGPLFFVEHLDKHLREKRG